MTDFSMVAGDSKTLEITVNDDAGAPVDLTGATIQWNAARRPYGTAVISKAGSITDAPAGKFTVLLEPADTASLDGSFYQAATITGGDGSVSTLFLGALLISPLAANTTVEQFKVRFPEFAPVSSTLIALVLDEALAQVSSCLSDADRTRAQMLLTAHKLTLEGEPGRTTSGAGAGTTGAVKREKVGSLEVEYAGMGTSSSGGRNYDRTVYGQMYWEQFGYSFPAIMVV